MRVPAGIQIRIKIKLQTRIENQSQIRMQIRIPIPPNTHFGEAYESRFRHTLQTGLRVPIPRYIRFPFELY